MQHYDTPVMDNTRRAEYVQCLVTAALGSGWRLARTLAGGDWDAWDCRRLAARQAWNVVTSPVLPPPHFDITPRKSRWMLAGAEWVQEPLDPPQRLADVYVFAWHGRRDAMTDQRNPGQWCFFVTPERDLPASQNSIGLARLKAVALKCAFALLGSVIRAVCPPRSALKVALEREEAGA